jgi:hypothetical protein
MFGARSLKRGRGGFQANTALSEHIPLNGKKTGRS